jgi:hypothetical protein
MGTSSDPAVPLRCSACGEPWTIPTTDPTYKRDPFVCSDCLPDTIPDANEVLEHWRNQ